MYTSALAVVVLALHVQPSLSGQCNYQWDTLMAGGDIKAERGLSAGECCNRCQFAVPGCRAVSHQEEGNWCHYKSNGGGGTFHKIGWQTMNVEGQRNYGGQCIRHYGQAMDGPDIKAEQGLSATDCCRRCQWDVEGCVAVSHGNGWCHYKGYIGTYFARAGWTTLHMTGQNAPPPFYSPPQAADYVEQDDGVQVQNTTIAIIGFISGAALTVGILLARAFHSRRISGVGKEPLLQA
jgi:hypothetical protein